MRQNRARVGTLTRTKDGCAFEYTPDFLATGSPPIARHLPLQGVFVFGPANLPAYFAGLLPEGVIQDAIVRRFRLSRDDLFSQLALAGRDAVGDITVVDPSAPPPTSSTSSSDARKALEAALRDGDFHQLGLISGVQPKVSIGQLVAAHRGESAIVKIEPERFPGLLQNEQYFMDLARRAGLRVPRVRLEDGALVVTRFDREPVKGQLPRQIHVEDALQVLDRYPMAKYSLDYVEILEAAVGLGVGKAVLLDLLRLYAFSYLIGNGDLHAKNVSFEFRPESGWSSTPAYDLVCTLPYFQDDPFGRSMALPMDEQVGDFRPADLCRVGNRFGLPQKAVEAMLRRTLKGIEVGLQTADPPIPASALHLIQARTSELEP